METTTEREDGVFRVPNVNVPRLRERIEKLAKRARRLGMPPIGLELVGTEERRSKDPESGAEFMVKVALVRVTGERPIINGWEFAATLQHVHGSDEPLTVIRTVPGVEGVPVQYRTAGPDCEHCRVNVWRRDTYLVRNVETGEWKQVGSSCLKDFTGHASPQAVAAYAEMLALAGDAAEGEERDFAAGKGGSHAFVGRDEYLSYVSRAIRVWGWRSRKAYREDPNGGPATADIAYDNMFPSRWLEQMAANGGPGTADWRSYGVWDDYRKGQPDDSDRAAVREALEWAEDNVMAKPVNELSDYLFNLRATLSGEWMEYRGIGLAASLMYVVARAKERDIERQRRASADATSEHFGTVGKRDTFTLTVTFLRDIESDWGGVLLAKFADPDGNVAVWFASRTPGIQNGGVWTPIEVGGTYRVKATVKRHDVRDGVKQTVLTRGSVLERVPEPADELVGVK